MCHANFAIDVDRPYRIALLPPVFQYHNHALIDQRPQIGVRAAAFLYRRSQFCLKCRTVDASRLGVHERVRDGQSPSWPGLRAIQSGIWIDCRGGGAVSLAGDFRWSQELPLPRILRGRFVDEPRWIDLRPYREAARARDARFTDLAADFSAALHGRPKEDLLSQEVRQQRRALRLASATLIALLALLGVAGWQWTVARAQRARAEHNLALATETANGLVFNLAQKFRDSGTPIAIISDVLSQASQLQDRLIAGGQTSPDLRYSQVAALDETAVTLLTIGNTKDALTAATKSHDLLRGLVAAAPQNTDYRRSLSLSDNKIGDVLRVKGDLTGALGRYRDGQAISRTLMQKDPGNIQWQRDLSIGDDRIGDVLRAQGDLSGALASYRDGQAIRKTLAQKDPSNTLGQRDRLPYPRSPRLCDRKRALLVA